MRSLYEKVLRLAIHRHATFWLAILSFFGGNILFVPVEAMLIPMTLAYPRAAWRYAFIATVSSVLGGVAGYIIGWYLFDILGKPILEFYGLMGKFAVFQDYYEEYGVWFTLFASVSPFPYKLITIAGGVAGFDFTLFLLSSFVGRAIRFYGVCALTYRFGPSIHPYLLRWLERPFVIFSFLFLLVSLIIASRYSS